MGSEIVVPILVGLTGGSFLLAAILLSMRSGLRLGRRRFASVQHLTSYLGHVTGFHGEPWPDAPTEGRGALDWVKLGGLLPSARPATIHFFTETVGELSDVSTSCVRLLVTADESPRLRVTQETVFTKIGKALGTTTEMEIGDAAFDARFLLETTTPRRASELLKGESRRAIARIFDLGARDLTIRDRKVAVTAFAYRVEPEDYMKIFEELDRIAQTFDRKKIRVRTIGSDRYAVVDPSGKTRCPFCRSNITGEEDELVVCETCHTIVHQACWKEHGGCPILGCEGRSTERARVR